MTEYERVVGLCRQRPGLGENYNLLTAYYFWTFHRRLFGVKEIKDLFALPSSESITRLYRLAVEKGDLPQPKRRLVQVDLSKFV